MELEAIKTVLDLAVKPHMDSLSRALETLTQEVKGLRSGLDHMKGEREGAKHEDRIAELASMKPRSFERGKYQGLEATTLQSASASMKPRSFERGKASLRNG